MGPGGVSETLVAHFAGYLRTTDDFVRARVIYDDGPDAVRSQPWQSEPVAGDAPHRIMEEFPTQPYRLPYSSGVFALVGAKVPHHPAPPPLELHPRPLKDMPAQPGEMQPPVQVGATPAGLTETLGTLAPTPDQLLFSAAQINLMENNNQYLTAHDGAATKLEALFTANDASIFNNLLTDMQALTLPGLAPQTSDTATLVDTLAAHDASEARHHPHAENLPTVAPGIYDNGTLQPASAIFNPTAPTVLDVTIETSHNGMTNPGLDAQTGGNVSVNAASILDDHTQSAGLVVMGNAFTTNAILQTNILYSQSQVEVGGATDSRHIIAGGNKTDNVASFGQHDINTGNLAQFSPTANVQVDEINGNFYDVKGTVQTNYLSNNDVVVQGTTSTFNEVDTGNNNQINYLPLSELNNYYDLIIVQGSYHTSNVISQRNVLLNHDAAIMYSARGDTASQSITTGDNTLTNSASIDHYGNTVFAPLTASISASMAGIESGSIDQTIASVLPGNGTGTMHVLYITGNFYNVNYISQTNVLLNTDTVVQYLPHVAHNHAPTGAPTSSTETINSGTNQLANLASIATVGTTSDFQFVGGQHYDDAILVQANLVEHKSQVTIGDTQTLAPEVAAFTGLQDAPPSHLAPYHHQAHSMLADAGHQQDLFHGVMS